MNVKVYWYNYFTDCANIALFFFFEHTGSWLHFIMFIFFFLSLYKAHLPHTRSFAYPCRVYFDVWPHTVDFKNVIAPRAAHSLYSVNITRSWSWFQWPNERACTFIYVYSELFLIVDTLYAYKSEVHCLCMRWRTILRYILLNTHRQRNKWTQSTTPQQTQEYLFLITK